MILIRNILIYLNKKETYYEFRSGKAEQSNPERQVPQPLSIPTYTQKLAKKMKNKLSESDKKIKEFVARNEEGTEATISADKITHIRDILIERL